MAARALRCESEQAADDCVAGAGIRPSTDSSELLAMLQFSTPQTTTIPERNQTMIPAIPMAQSQTIEQRIRELFDKKRSRRALNKDVFAAALALALGALFPLATVQLQAAEATAATGGNAPARALDLSTPEAAVKAFIDALQPKLQGIQQTF